MRYSILRQKLLLPEYAGLTDADAAAKMSAATITEIYSRRVDERDIIREVADPATAEAILEKFETVGGANKLIRRVLGWLSPNQGGIDVGDPKTRAMLDSLVGTAGITQQSVDSLKAMATRKISPATQYGIGPVVDAVEVWQVRHEYLGVKT